MKIRFLKLKNWLLMTAMGLLGMTACHSPKEATKGTQPPLDPKDPVVEPDARNFAVMYGVPQMDFRLSGRVVDAEGRPVEGMQVVLVNQTIDISPDYMQEDNPHVQQYLRSASDTTDAEGRFEASVRDVPVESQRVIVRDIDGEKGGSYQSQMLEVKFGPEDQTEQGSKWYQGQRSKEVEIVVEEK